jgi:DNA-directed RNA polymerase specialized sigma24 family protein
MPDCHYHYGKEKLMDYYIKIKEIRIPVTEEVYKAYCKGARKERYFRESDIKNKTFFYDALDTDEVNGSDMFQDTSAQSVEDIVEKNILMEKLKESMSLLAKEDKELLSRLYVYGDSLRRTAQIMKVPVTTLQARHQRLLKKLKKTLEE